MILQFLKSGGGVFLADLSGKILGFILISGLTFLLAPDDLGKYNALFTAAMSLYIFSGWGVPIVLQRQSASSGQKDKLVLGQMISSGLVIMMSSMILLMGILYMLKESFWEAMFPGLDPQLLFWVPLLTLGYFFVQSPLSILLGLGKFKTYAFRSATEAAISLGCVLIGALRWGLHGAIVGLFIALCINTLITVLILRRAFLKERIALSFVHLRKRIGQLLSQGSYYFVGNTLMGVIANIVMISLFANHIGYDDFGFLRVAMSVTAIIAVIPNAAKTVTITYIARFKEASTYMKSLQIRYLFFTLIVTTVLMSLLLQPVVSILFGERYMEGMHVYRMVLYLNVLFNMHQVLNGFVVGHGSLRYSGIVSTAIVLIFIALMAIFIPSIGMVGYYLAFGACYLIGLLVLVQYEITQRSYDDSGMLKKVIFGALILLLSLLFVSMLSLSPWLRICLELGLLLIYCAGHIWYAFPIGEISRIRALLRTQLKLT